LTLRAGLSRLEETMDQVLSVLAGSEQKWFAEKEEMIAARRWSTLFYD